MVLLIASKNLYSRFLFVFYYPTLPVVRFGKKLSKFEFFTIEKGKKSNFQFFSNRLNFYIQVSNSMSHLGQVFYFNVVLIGIRTELEKVLV